MTHEELERENVDINIKNFCGGLGSVFTSDWQILCSNKDRSADFHKYTSEERLCEHTVCERVALR